MHKTLDIGLDFHLLIFKYYYCYVPTHMHLHILICTFTDIFLCICLFHYIICTYNIMPLNCQKSASMHTTARHTFHHHTIAVHIIVTTRTYVRNSSGRYFC